MNFVVKKTTELTEKEQRDILCLFNVVFDRNRSLEQFQNQFLNNVLGYSFHSLIIEDEVIVGCNSYIPGYYTVNGVSYLFANSVDTAVSKPYRDFANFYDMVVNAYDYMRKSGVTFMYGFPNDNSYLIFKKAKLSKDIGDLSTYCLPYRIGGVKPYFKILNTFSKILSLLWISITSCFASSKVVKSKIEKEAASYNVSRYKRLDADYKIVKREGYEFIYKIIKHESVRTAFLLDVTTKSARNFNKTVRYIVKNESSDFDLLLYVGHLPFSCTGLLRLARKFEPKTFHFTGMLLDKKDFDEALFYDINNWDVNLSNYDLL